MFSFEISWYKKLLTNPSATQRVNLCWKGVECFSLVWLTFILGSILMMILGLHQEGFWSCPHLAQESKTEESSDKIDSHSSQESLQILQS